MKPWQTVNTEAGMIFAQAIEKAVEINLNFMSFLANAK
jgi:hypothetical protein